MLKKTITYVDFNGTQRTEDHYFNLTKAELAEMELAYEGGMVKHLNEIVASNDGQKLVDTFKELILKSYGERSEDGKRFIKSKELSEEFSQSVAYSELFMELVTDPEATKTFINSVIPATMNK